MRLCRYKHNGNVETAYYTDDGVAPLSRLAAEMSVRMPVSASLLEHLPPDGKLAQPAMELHKRFEGMTPADQARLRVPLAAARVLTPLTDPKKVILLAGNYAEHIREGGGVAVERQETYPYFFWKPPTTTLTNPSDPIRIPKVSPNHVDWEIELAVVIGRTCRDVSEQDALKFVAGYTICNDISDRKFQINPARKTREKDRYFDWLHGKWHDTFLPMGPCILSAADMPDPQKFPLKLRVSGQTMQDSNTAQMIFPVAAIVSILASFVTLEPGDVVVTGTPAGVGHGRKPPVYLKAGDVVDAEITGIGVLSNPVV